MAGTSITITSNAEKVSGEIETIAKRCGSPGPAMKIIGETVKTSVVENFQAGGRPSRWQALSPVTLAKKHGGSILIGRVSPAG
jgi:phage gpG-like protein